MHHTMLFFSEGLKIEIIDLPLSEQASEQWENDPNAMLCAVSPTDEDGWTIIWSDFSRRI